MRKILLVVIILTAVVVSGAVYAAEEPNAQTSTTPPSIYLPSGSNIVTDINVSDDNVLGIVKTATSALLDDLQDVNIQAVCPASLPASVTPANIKKLVESTYGIKGIRVLAAQYYGTPQQFIQQFEVGVPKAGDFTRIVMDKSNGEVVLLLYAQPDNGGYLGAAYDPRAKMIYAARVVGFVDVKQLMDVAGDLAKAFIGDRMPQAIITAPPTTVAQ